MASTAQHGEEQSPQRPALLAIDSLDQRHHLRGLIRIGIWVRSRQIRGRLRQVGLRLLHGHSILEPANDAQPVRAAVLHPGVGDEARRSKQRCAG